MVTLKRVRELIFGPPLDPLDARVRHAIAVTPLLAFVLAFEAGLLLAGPPPFKRQADGPSSHESGINLKMSGLKALARFEAFHFKAL